ncbi:MAG: hypothetical protein RLZZ623_3934 [Actinomycetota bacterium]|jgi:TetR/AcrR family transcriptional regulator, cholesterol catabolism regulator
MGAADTREDILRVSARLFEMHGIGGTTMRAIASGCSIKAASLYHHFASKDEIVAEVMTQSSAFASALYADVRDANLDPAERVEALMRVTVQCFRAYPEASRAFVENAEYVAAAPLLKPVRAAARVIDRQWTEAIVEGIAVGVLRDGIEPARMWSLLREMLLATSRSTTSGRVDDVLQIVMCGVFTSQR